MRKNIFTQSGLVSLSKLIEKILSFVLIAYASRKLGSGGIGEFFYTFSLVSLFIPLMDVGYEKVFLQKWALEGEKSSEEQRCERSKILTELSLLKLATGAVTLALLLLIDTLSRGESSHHKAIVASFFAIYLEQFGMLFRSPQRANYGVLLEVVVPVASRTITFLLILFFISSIEEGYQICYLYFFSTLVGTSLSLFGLNGISPIALRTIDYKRCISHLRYGVPFSVTGLFVMASLYVDSVILGHYSIDQVGDYNAAYRIILVFGLLSGGICHTIFPRILAWHREKSPLAISSLLTTVCLAFLLLFGAMAIGCLFFGKAGIIAIYGESFFRAGDVFLLLAPLVLLLAFTNLFGQTLEAMHRQKVTMSVCMVSATFNLASNLVFIPLYGMNGAAVTTLFTEAISLGFYLYFLLRTIPSLSFRKGELATSLLFLALFALVCSLLKDLDLWIALPTALTFALVCLYFIKNYFFEKEGRVEGCD